MTTSIVCAACGHEQTADIAVICSQCSSILHGQLRGARTLLGLLRDTAARLGRVDRVAGNDDDVRRTLDSRFPLTAAASPSPVDFGATEAARHLRRTVKTWAERLLDEQPPGTDYGDLTDGARWLADRWKVVRTRPWAGECARQIGAAIRRAETHVDQPPEEWFAGHCDVALDDPDRPGETYACGWELYARLASDTVRCRGCGTTHDVAARRAQLIASAGDVLVTAAQAARALTEPGHEITAAMVRGWKHRGGLTPATRVDDAGGTIPLCDERGRPLYRLADVQAAHNQTRYGTVTTSTGRAS